MLSVSFNDTMKMKTKKITLSLAKLDVNEDSHHLVKILSSSMSNDHVARVLEQIDKQDELCKKGIMLNAVKSRFYHALIFYDIDALFLMLDEKEHG